MVILIGILTTVLFAIVQTIKDDTPSEKTHVPNQALSDAIAKANRPKTAIEVFESTVVALFVCLGIAIFIGLFIRLWINEF